MERRGRRRTECAVDREFWTAMQPFAARVIWSAEDGRIAVMRLRLSGGHKVRSWLGRTPVLTRDRVPMAFAVAVAADALQLLLGPLGWAGADEIIDVAA